MFSANSNGEGKVATGWLWLSAPIAALALASSLIGLFVRDTYAQETPNWRGQTAGQDWVNLVAYVALVVAAVLAARGSVRAHLVWNGLVAYSAYNFAIYAFSLHFGRLFLVHVAVFGLSVFALVGGIASIDVVALEQRMVAPPTRTTGVVLIVVGAIISLLWLGQIIPAAVHNDVPQAVKDAGLLTNPVHVLDLGILLPSGILAGVLLLHHDRWGYVLAPTVLVCIAVLGVGIVAAMVVLRARGEEASLAVAGVITVMTLVESVAVARLLAAVH